MWTSSANSFDKPILVQNVYLGFKHLNIRFKHHLLWGVILVTYNFLLVFQ